MGIEIEIDEEVNHSRRLRLVERAVVYQLYRAEKDLSELDVGPSEEQTEYIQRLRTGLNFISELLKSVEQKEEDEIETAKQISERLQESDTSF